jgi:hypothetical protein
MITKALLTAAIAGALVLGCAFEPVRTKTHVTCQTPNCEIKVLVADGQVTVDIEELEIRVNRDVHVLWRLPPGYEFITSQGDGVFFKLDDEAQFEEPYVTDDERGQPSSNKRSGRNFHWRDKNTVYKYYEYKIQFHDRSGRPYYKDPTILNGI